MGLINQLDDATCGLDVNGVREGGGLSEGLIQLQCYFISPCMVSAEALICRAQDIGHETEQKAGL